MTMRKTMCAGAMTFFLVTIHLSSSLPLSTDIQNRLPDIGKQNHDYIDQIRQLREFARSLDMRSANEDNTNDIVPDYSSKDIDGNKMNQVQRFGRMELSKEKKSANTVNHFLRDRKDKQNMLHFLRDRRAAQNQLSHFLRDRKSFLAQGDSLQDQGYDEPDTDFLRQARNGRTQSHFLRDRKFLKPLHDLFLMN